MPVGCKAREDVEHISDNCVKLWEVLNYLNIWGFGVPIFYLFYEF